MINMLDHVTWSRAQTGYKYPALSHNLQLLAPDQMPNYSRRNSFTLKFELLFSSYFTNSSLLWSGPNSSKTFSNYVFAKFQLHLIEIILRHFKNVSLPKFHSLCLPNPYSCHWSLKSVLLTLALVLACADSVDELRFWSKSES